MHIDNAFMRTYVQAAAAAASIGKLGFSLKDRFFFCYNYVHPVNIWIDYLAEI